MAKFGESGIRILERPRSMAVFAKCGEDAAARHGQAPGITESLIEKEGAAAARAFSELSTPNARRLAMLADDGTLAALGSFAGTCSRQLAPMATGQWSSSGSTRERSR